MATRTTITPAEWDRATSMMPLGAPPCTAPQGALIPDAHAKIDHVAVVYNKGDTPPKITVRDVSNRVQTVLADGVAVAVVGRPDGPALTAQDVLLVERSDGRQRHGA